MEYSARLTFLFDRYLNKQLSPAELEEMLSLLKDAGAEDLLTPAMQTVWDQLKEATYPVDWQKMHDTITQPQSTPVHKITSWYKAAAAILIITAGAGIYWFANKAPNPETVPAIAATTQEHRPAQFRTIHLPDGSTVTLNVNSKLDYAPAFNGETREVYLSGEGFFDIKTDAARPFLVHTGKITTKVLGTSFNIKAYPTDKAIKVTVATGRVQVMRDSLRLGLIAANEQLSVDIQTDKFVKEAVNAVAAITWKSPELVFSDINMEEAALRIKERFGMEVEFSNPALKNCRITATFLPDDRPEQLLTVLCGVSKSTYTIQNNKITIYGKGCQ